MRIRWVWVFPLAAALCTLLYYPPAVDAAAPPSPAVFVPPVAASTSVEMPSAPQTGWRPASLQTNLELHFAPSGVLQRPRFVGI